MHAIIRHGRPWPARLAALVLLAAAAGLGMASAAEVLALDEAERLALVNEPTLAQLEAQAAALREEAVAAGQLPDPRASLGFLNFPTDSFAFDQDPMTQIQLGLSQDIPPGRSLALRRAGLEAEAGIEEARLGDQARGVLLATRLAWLGAFHDSQVLDILEENLELLNEILEITEFLYSTGRENRQDILRTELEISLLEDRMIEMVRSLEAARADLARWIGAAAAARPLPETPPDLAAPAPLPVLREALARHPRLAAEERTIAARRLDVEQAEQLYKPEFEVGVSYGIRDEDRMGRDLPDFASAMVSMSIPLFTAKRQDRRMAAARLGTAAAEFARDAQLRELLREAETDYAAWRRLKQRLELFDETVFEQTEETVEAVLDAYRADVTDFSSVIRAQLAELETRLDAHRVRIDLARTQARLLYYAGEPE